MDAEKEGENIVGEKWSGNTADVWKREMFGEWRKIREHAETYPYVWGSYIMVYGSFGVYLSYLWWKLRKTESRVRVLQNRLRKLVEDEEKTPSATPKIRVPTPDDDKLS